MGLKSTRAEHLPRRLAQWIGNCSSPSDKLTLTPLSMSLMASASFPVSIKECDYSQIHQLSSGWFKYEFGNHFKYLENFNHSPLLVHRTRWSSHFVSGLYLSHKKTNIVFNIKPIFLKKKKANKLNFTYRSCAIDAEWTNIQINSNEPNKKVHSQNGRYERIKKWMEKNYYSFDSKIELPPKPQTVIIASKIRNFIFLQHVNFLSIKNQAINLKTQGGSR